MSSDDRAFGADRVAQAGHELHIPLAEPGVCGLVVDEQLEASGPFGSRCRRISVFETSKRREYSRAEFARDIEGFMAMISRAPDSERPMSRQYSPQLIGVCVSGCQCSMRSSFACSCCSACSCRAFSSRLARFQRSDLFVQGGVLRVEAVDLLLLPLDAGGADHRPDPSTIFDPTSRCGVFNQAPFNSPFTLFSSASVRFSSALFCAWSVAVCSYSVRTCRSCCLKLLDGLPLLLFETEQCVDVLLQILLLGNGLPVELLRGDVARLRTVDAALQSVFGHRRGVGVLILLEADARHDVVGAEAGPCGGFGR